MNRSKVPFLPLVAVAAIAFALGVSGGALVGGARAEDAPAKGKVYEMRTYTAAPGKLEALNARFRDHTTAIFAKHGMESVGYWTPLEGPEAETTLIYILAHADRESARKSWAAFSLDPAWRSAREESERDGKLVEKVESKFLSPTDYSALK